MTQIHELTALELAAAVRSRSLSPVEIAEHYLDRIIALNRSAGAYVTVTREIALRQARQAERRALDAAEPDTLPPLLGVPVPVQDLVPVRDVRLTLGSAACEGIVAPVDDDVVRRLRAAGGVLTGKTTTPEFGLACFTESDVAPPARNPWSPERTAGGAGGGAAVAVAAGLAPVAHGLDGIGSLRVPAAACGVVGFRPSRGRIPAETYGPDPFGLSAPGVVTRTVADAAMLLDVMAGAAEGYWTPAGQARSFTARAQRDPGRLRVGCTTAGAAPGAEPDPEIRLAFEETKTLLEELGHQVVDIAPVLGPGSARHVDALWFAAAHLHSVRSSRAHQLRPLTSWLRGMGRRAGSGLLQAHDELLRAMRAALPRQEAAVDVVLTPTLAQVPPPIGWFTDEVAPPETFERMRAFSPYVTEANLTGRPSITLPLYWTSAGLPIGMMLTGHWGQEGTLLALGTQIEASRYLSRRIAAQHLTAA